MRVIAGEARGRKLTAPGGLDVRPTADRVRQSVFDMLAVRAEAGHVLDLFAGSGALGIEALSRGARRAVFVERAAPALKALEENLAACRFLDRAEVRRSDFRAALKALAGQRFDLVFVDPPYEGPARDEAVGALAPVLAPGAWIVVETAAEQGAPASPADWRLEAERKYGRTRIFLYHYAVDDRHLPG
jgi:16S rRNA (guanine(966)-N(2))-methyltransferase RsmD